VLDYSPELKNLQREMQLQQALSLQERSGNNPCDIRITVPFSMVFWIPGKTQPAGGGRRPGRYLHRLDGLQMIYEDDEVLVKPYMPPWPSIFDARIACGGKFLAYLAAWHSPSGSYKTLTGDIAAFLNDLACDLLPVSLKSKEKLHSFGCISWADPRCCRARCRRNSGRKVPDRGTG